MREGSGQTIYLKDYQPPEFFIEHTDLYFNFEGDKVKVSNRMKIFKSPDSKSTEVFLNGEGLELKGIFLNGQPMAPEFYKETPEGLWLYQVPSRFDLEVKTELKPSENTSLEGLYCSSAIYATQNEPEGFRRITYFLDRPDVLSTFTTTLEADRRDLPLLLSNGNRTSVEERSNGRHIVKWHDPFPKPCYLFCVVAGRLDKITDKFTTRSGREIKLEIYTAPARTHLCHHAMQSLKRAMLWDEERFGLEYDLDLYMIVAIDDFNGGAMENKGLNIFNSRLILADEATATDADFENIEAVVAHEYFHNWTGNRVTLRDWFQLSLKEGLTVYRDREFTSDMTSRAVKRIEDVKFLRTRQFAEDAGPSAHSVRPESCMSVENFFTTTIYEKGAELIQMIEQLIGRDGFRRGMDLYVQRHDGQAVTTDDFVRAMEEANSIDLEQFRNWYRYAGTPRVNVKDQYDEATKTYTLELEQICPDTAEQKNKPPFHIPLSMALLDSRGEIMKGCEDFKLVELKEFQQKLEFHDIPERPVLSILRSFSAPVILSKPTNTKDLLFLAAHDSDSFNRWEALQKLFVEEYRTLYKSFAKGEPLESSEEFLQIFEGYFEANQDIDPAYIAHLIKLPHPYFIAQSLGELSPRPADAARLAIGQKILFAHRDKVLKRYEELEGKIPSGKEYHLVAQRRLKNQLLQLLCNDIELQELAAKQFQNAKTMTDQIAALSALCIQPEAPSRDRLLQQFYDQWQLDSLVLNKWLALEAAIPREDQLQRIQELTAHPAFELKNPNKVYSLIGYFATENHIAFHRTDGQAYEFYLQKIAEIDRLNPSVAARLSQAFQVKPLLERSQQDILTSKMTQLLSEQSFSKNTLEILQKMAGVSNSGG